MAGSYQRLLERRIDRSASGPALDSGIRRGRRVLSAQLLTLDAEDDGPVRLELQGLDAELPAALTIMGVAGRAPRPGHGAYVAGQVNGPALGVLAACEKRRGYPSAVLGLTEPNMNLGGTATQVRAQEEQVETMVDGHALHPQLAEVTRPRSGRDSGRCPA